MLTIINTLSHFIFFDFRTTLLSLFIGYVVFKLSKFYYQVYSLPPGPFPLPILGNILKFRGTKEIWSIELERIAQRYGPVMTLWINNTPHVIISDVDMLRDAFRNNDFAGRPDNIYKDLFVTDKHADIVMSDYGHTWEELRKVTHLAVQKYSTTEKLNDLVIDIIDHTMDSMVKREGFNKPFVISDYIHNIFLNIMVASCFGKRYELNDPEYKLIKYAQKDMVKEINQNASYWEFFPLIRKFDKKYTNFKSTIENIIEFTKEKYYSQHKDHDENVIRNLSDTLIKAKNEALRKGKESAPYLTDANLSLCLFNLIMAGTDTTHFTFRWILLYILYYKSIEKRLRKEIESEIGDRIPSHEDKNRCHYVMAFISEAMRHSSTLPLAAPHKAVVTSKLGDYTIPKGTEVLSFLGYIHHKEEHWPQPFEFRPERFLDENGKYLSTRPKAFIPFGFGRRVCLGKKIAIADLFLVLVRFLQKTAHYELVLHMETENPLLPDPNIINILEIHPKHYEISFNKINNI